MLRIVRRRGQNALVSATLYAIQSGSDSVTPAYVRTREYVCLGRRLAHGLRGDAIATPAMFIASGYVGELQPLASRLDESRLNQPAVHG